MLKDKLIFTALNAKAYLHLQRSREIVGDRTLFDLTSSSAVVLYPGVNHSGLCVLSMVFSWL